MEEGRRQRRPVVSLVLEDDLRECHRGQVLAARRIEDRDLLAGADHLLDLFERHVAAFLGVVELSVRVSLDDVRHRTRTASLTPCVKPHKATTRATLRGKWRGQRELIFSATASREGS